MNDLQQQSVGLKVLTGDMDTTTTTGRLIFATLAEFERDLINERTVAGLAAARTRTRSRAGGRPRVITLKKLKVAMAMMADRDNTARGVAADLGVSLSTLYAYVDGKEKPRERANELLARRSTKRDAKERRGVFLRFYLNPITIWMTVAIAAGAKSDAILGQGTLRRLLAEWLNLVDGRTAGTESTHRYRPRWTNDNNTKVGYAIKDRQERGRSQSEHSGTRCR